MGFIGSNVMRVGGSKFYQPLKSLGGVAVACNRSEYDDGTGTPIYKDFVYRAPMHLVQDSISNETVSVDWKATGFDLRLDANVIFSDQALNSRYVRHESSLSGTAIVSISFLNASAEARFFVRDSSGNNYGFSVDTTELDANSFRFVFDQPNSMVYAYVDDVLKDSAAFSIAAPDTLTMDMHYISNEDIGSNFATMLLSTYEATGLGKADFVTNQDDGLNIISDNGTVWLTTEDIAGSSQIKSDGTSSTAYEWDEDVKVVSPLTGDIYSGGDLIGNRDPITNIFTPDALFPDAEYISDKWQTETECIIVTNGQPPSIGGDFTTEFTSEFF